MINMIPKRPLRSARQIDFSNKETLSGIEAISPKKTAPLTDFVDDSWVLDQPPKPKPQLEIFNPDASTYELAYVLISKYFTLYGRFPTQLVLGTVLRAKDLPWPRYFLFGTSNAIEVLYEFGIYDLLVR